MNKLRKAFTLPELLVVTAITTGLIALLVPSLSKARNQARALNCMANQRNTYLLFNNSVHEITPDRKVPIDYRDRDKIENDFIAKYCITNQHPDSYLGNLGVTRPKVLNCPDAIEGQTASPVLTLAKQPLNAQDNTPNVMFFRTYDYLLESISQQKPEETLANRAVWEFCSKDDSPVGYSPWFPIPNIWKYQMILTPNQGHRKSEPGANYTFGDGHGRWISFKELPQ